MPLVSNVKMTSVSEEGGGRGELLSRDECLCPVCLEIFLEPVTLPCGHTFCKPCFLETVDKATLCCPMCRKRVSTWARLNSRKQTLVNDELWRQVQAAFPLQCQRRLIGQEGGQEEEDQVFVSTPRVCPPGEVRREYEDQISKLAEEKRSLEEAERRASEEYIQQLLAEEEEQMAEERRRQEERQLEDDEKLATLLSQQLNSSPMSDLPGNVSSAEVTPAKRKQKSGSGAIERFLCPVKPKLSSSDSNPISTFMTNKENILCSQVTPRASLKEPTKCPMPTLEYYGRLQGPVHPPLPAPPRLQAGTAKSPPVCTQAHPDTEGALSGKRKSSEMEASQEEPDVAKHICSSSVTGGMQGQTQREVEFFTRLQQEEEDRRLALLLQEELNKEAVQRATDRSKESSNPYQLRQKSSAQPGPGTAGAADQASSSKPTKACSSSSTAKKNRTERRISLEKKTSNSCTSSSVTSSCKQVTLTEMFPRQGGVSTSLSDRRDK
ncbi:E3 ubiquitin-protein ligase rnf168 [Lampris incognitus]|uniref:E3 ubiquitin-protein ligase rnf168 n=1 Tax=Lampris incognitus TaxID=2546036 RepID=UPI0024B5F467|nr:E3 ubiquitin-protein ligase rnf168 [Lampris incognitus]XP_056139506.1 E3 ubiquitin-protein ligase rnf168 [Lampris incognitus]XP_056139507.1 E3 ubiquitin-protein ligase rnf168 [Lampris incognitus]